jgi:osmotically inducible lipoprotein OsmB
MKKFFVVTLMFVVLGFIVPSASAQSRHRTHRHSRSFWQKHRDKLTVGGTTVAGAGIGGLVGGKKGALIGTGAGAGAGALYTYKFRKRHRRRY